MEKIKLKTDNIIDCITYSSIYFNALYLIVSLFAIYFANKEKLVGIIISVLVLFVLCFLPYTVGYLPLTMMKIMLITFGSIIFFSSFKFTCVQPIINQILTMWVRLNIFCLIITINNIFMIISLLFLTITTPIFTVKNTNVKMESVIISKNVWVLLYTILLAFYHIINPYFCHNVSMVVLAVVIPCLMHFLNNQFLESRALCLCVLFVFDIFNNSQKTIADFIHDSKY